MSLGRSHRDCQCVQSDNEHVGVRAAITNNAASDDQEAAGYGAGVACARQLCAQL